MEFGQVGEYLKKQANFFQSSSTVRTKEEIMEIIYSNDRGIYILYGDKGVGKSRLIREITKQIQDDIYLFSAPPSSEREFFEQVYLKLRNRKFAQNVKIDEVRIRVNDAFKKIAHTIIVDGIYMDNIQFLENIINIADSISGLKIIFVLDEDAYSKLRSKDVSIKQYIQLPLLSQQETSQYIDFVLHGQEIDNETNNILKEIDFIYSVTNGNIGKVTDLISTAFQIVDIAYRDNIDKFKSINECVLIMSAIDRELVDG